MMVATTLTQRVIGRRSARGVTAVCPAAGTLPWGLAVCCTLFATGLATAADNAAPPQANAQETDEAESAFAEGVLGKPTLVYSWEEGFHYIYSFTMTATVVGKEQVVIGAAVYSAAPYLETLMPTAKQHGEPSVSKCTGTAFAVTPEGVLVTCAHVVEGATKITAHFGEKTYSAQVIAYDPDIDLALLKIESEGLPYLPFWDSDRVQLAQEVRVVGYPLSDMLGESVKISRGTISGIIERESEDRFQIDARVNPGNSGGPLVDQQGRVVGIASELLADESIDSIGLAIPANRVMAMLREKSITPKFPEDGPILDGPVLAGRVTPAVAFLNVQSRNIGKAKREFLGVTGGYRGVGAIPSRKETGDLIVDSYGHVECRDKSPLIPFVFQPVMTLGIEPLPDDGRKKWNSIRLITLTRSTPSSNSRPRSISPLSPFGLMRPPSFGSPYGRILPPGMLMEPEPEVVRVLPAIEEIQYAWLSESPEGLVTISKKVHLCSIETIKNDEGEETPTIELKTEGTFTWDKTLGCVKASEVSGQLSCNDEGISARIPLTLSYDFEKKKVEKRSSPTASTPSPTKEEDSRPSVRKIEPTTVGTTPVSSPKPVPSLSGLNKFNPDD